MEPSRILEIYTLRWGIEVYFKESNRHLDLLKEQTNSFSKQLWALFHALIHNGLSGIKQQFDCPVDQIMEVIEEHINHFFAQALQLDSFTLKQETMDNEA